MEDQNSLAKLLKSIFGFKEQTATTRLPLVQMVSNFRRTFLGRLPLQHPKIKEIKKCRSDPPVLPEVQEHVFTSQPGVVHIFREHYRVRSCLTLLWKSTILVMGTYGFLHVERTGLKRQVEFAGFFWTYSLL